MPVSNNNSKQFTAKVEVIGAPNHPYNHTIKVDNPRVYVYKPFRTLNNY